MGEIGGPMVSNCSRAGRRHDRAQWRQWWRRAIRSDNPLGTCRSSQFKCARGKFGESSAPKFLSSSLLPPSSERQKTRPELHAREPRARPQWCNRRRGRGCQPARAVVAWAGPGPPPQIPRPTAIPSREQFEPHTVGAVCATSCCISQAQRQSPIGFGRARRMRPSEQIESRGAPAERCPRRFCKFSHLHHFRSLCISSVDAIASCVEASSRVIYI